MPKNSVFVESGQRGARRRWGPPRVVRLDDPSMLPEEREVIQALLNLKRRREEAEQAAPKAAAA